MSNPRIKWGSDNQPRFPAITREHYVETPETVIDYMLHLERTVAALAPINAAYREDLVEYSKMKSVIRKLENEIQELKDRMQEYLEKAEEK